MATAGLVADYFRSGRRTCHCRVADEASGAADAVKVGDKVLVDMFEGERFVDVVGTSKGRGFAGVVKRHHAAPIRTFGAAI